jgi:hypothetical protein
MSRSIFGWSLPPGAASDPFAPYNAKEPPCAVCGNFSDSCICPECPVCGSQGDPACYDDTKGDPEEPDFYLQESHGLVRSAEQIESLRAAEAEWAAQAKAEYEGELYISQHPPEEGV